MSSPRLFGTDGIRGVFGRPPLDAATVYRLGRALAQRLETAGSDPKLALGGDTRDSTPTLGRWLAAGLEDSGVTVIPLGTVPTPAVAFAARQPGMAGGIAISASHNPHPDNGIKLIGPDGFKWSPAEELLLEEALDATVTVPTDLDAREIPSHDSDLPQAYLASLAATLPGERPLAGLTVALDTANGAAAPYARSLFERLGARVDAIHEAPDGRNINLGCGSTHPNVIAAHTGATGSAIGFAFDGDADRVLLADERGEIHDGDAVLYLWARQLAADDRLPGARIVATSMSNLGLEVALRRAGIGLVRCDVGDRVVVATMQREGIVLGGEQSGHTVHLELSTTGDGMLTALHMAWLLHHGDASLNERLNGFERFPQLIRNVPVARKPELASLPQVEAARAAVANALGKEGRLVLRYSGTEPLARIMIEGADQEQIESLAAELAAVLAAELS